MIDVHLLLLGTENDDLLNQCLESLKSEPITLHIVDGIWGNLQKARSNALKLGSNDYVGWVDPDDLIIPGSYQKLLNNIKDKKFAWMKEEIWVSHHSLDKVDDIQYKITPHHMHIIHRNILDFNLIENASKHDPDYWVNNYTKDGVYLNEVGYIWRKYPHSGGELLRKDMRLFDK